MAKNILFKNVLGEHVLNPQYILTKKPQKHVREPTKEDFPEILEAFTDKFSELRKENIRICKEKIKESFSRDMLLGQTINAIDEISKSISLLQKRLYEWASYPWPEIANEEDFNNALSSFVNKDLPKQDERMIRQFQVTVNTLYKERKELEEYLEVLIKELCPNLAAVAGPTIGARLIEMSGNLKKLAMSAASKIQLLGAEEALFRHLRTGSKVPKHGLIHEHSYIQSKKRHERGKAARRLADKISMAAKIDYFKGEYQADKLLKGL